MIFLTILFSVDFGKMREYEKKALDGETRINKETETKKDSRGKVIDLVLPVIALIILSVVSMLYTGSYFEGEISIGEAFANCDAIRGLSMGAVYTTAVVCILYLPRKVITLKEFLDGLVEGFKNMVPAALILIFAWTLSGICGGDYLDAGGFVADTVSKYSVSLNIMPTLFFIIALLLSFSTGTSWGTFAILLPITISVFRDQFVTLMIITTAAVLGGSVCGDHISPISDTTILSSTGADCNHINHVTTQMQYGLVVAGISLISYLVSGFTENIVTGFITGFIILIIFIFSVKSYYYKREAGKNKLTLYKG